MTAILDAGFLFALADTRDRNHNRVLNIARTISGPFLIPVSVLPEICYLIASRLGHQAMRRFLEELVAGDTILESITTNDLERVTEILNQYAGR